MAARLLIWSIAATAAWLSAACDKVPLLAPTGTTITLTADSQTVAPGATARVTAFLIESAGTPVHDGTLVRFSSTLGTVNPVEVETRGGLAITTFTAGSTRGTAQIRATSGAATGGDGEAPTNLIEIQVGAGTAGSISVTANPSRVPANGGTVSIIASALDASGNRLVGEPVSFSTTAGTLSATVATTDSSGEARVSLTTNRNATVTARVGSGDAARTGTAEVVVGVAPGLTLATTPNNPLAGVPVTLTITPAAGTASRVSVNWGDGAVEDLGIVTAARSATHTYQRSGSYTISATATEDGQTFTSSTPVTVGSAAGVELRVDTTNPTEGSPVLFTVTPATAGTTPSVVIEWGDGSSDSLGTITGSRTVTHTYGSSGTFVVTARSTSGGDTFVTTRVVDVAPRPALNVSVSASPTQPGRCQPVTFTATHSPTTVSIASYRWTIVSSVDSENAEVTTTGNSLTRAFPNPGTKTVTVTATATDGRVGNGQTQVVVQATGTCPP